MSLLRRGFDTTQRLKELTSLPGPKEFVEFLMRGAMDFETCRAREMVLYNCRSSQRLLIP